MIAQFVQFETSLTTAEVEAIARERAPEFRALPDLVQKYYLRLNRPNHCGGFYIWKSREAMQAFRETELAKSIPSAYRIIGAPVMDIHTVLFPLREENLFRSQQASA